MAGGYSAYCLLLTACQRYALLADEVGAVDLQFVRKTRLVSLEELRRHKPLAGMLILQRGNRLSITPVAPAEWNFIMRMLGDE